MVTRNLRCPEFLSWQHAQGSYAKLKQKTRLSFVYGHSRFRPGSSVASPVYTNVLTYTILTVARTQSKLDTLEALLIKSLNQTLANKNNLSVVYTFSSHTFHTCTHMHTPSKKNFILTLIVSPFPHPHQHTPPFSNSHQS